MSERLRYLAATLALTAIAVGYLLVQRGPAKPEAHLPTRPTETRPLAPPPLPTARIILDRRRELDLTKDQRARLESLDQRWQSESGGLEAAVRREEEAFSRFMLEAQAGGKTSLQEIQRRSGDLRELSGTLRERRQQHADAALDVLTKSQRQMLSTLAASSGQGGA
jgi:hypothetical protein